MCRDLFGGCDQAVPAGLRIAGTTSDLAAINAEDCAAVLWQRPPVEPILSWLKTIDPVNLPKTRLILPAQAVRDAVCQVCDISGLADCAARDQLIDDIAALAQRFSELMKTDFVRLRLDVVTTNACRKFHVDAVTARLVCTYRGTGTQFGIGKGTDDPKEIFTVPTGSPLILRGSNWPEQPRSGLKHRSPPIEDTGETRLLLVLDPVTDANEEGRHERQH